jgi:transketolase
MGAERLLAIQNNTENYQMPSRKKLADAVRALSMDAVQAANSGHPGMPMGMADVAEVLWNDHVRHNPANPDWPDRDRVVLSNGHGSMLVYSVLHLTGYDLPIEELKNFRQLHSRTAGHPEAGETPGVETTTGPLGQGIANAVGMALAEKALANRFNRGDHTLVDHHTWVLLGDGCLMEGISHEVCSLAGTLKLGKLICLYDDNGISIDGEVQGWFTDDTRGRFEAYGWQVIDGVDGHDAEALGQAIGMARAESERPSLICCKTVIGYGSPNKQGTEATHGAPLVPMERETGCLPQRPSATCRRVRAASQWCTAGQLAADIRYRNCRPAGRRSKDGFTQSLPGGPQYLWSCATGTDWRISRSGWLKPDHLEWIRRRTGQR